MLASTPSSLIPTPTTTTTPLLSPPSDDRVRSSLRRQSLREAARYLRRASSRRMMREPSMLVRETAAEQLEERQSDWAYSKPVVILDLIWNFAFVAVAVVVLVLSADESHGALLRAWIVGYGAQCVVHMVCVWAEYKKRRRRRLGDVEDDGGIESGSSSASGSGARGNGSSRYVTLAAQLTEESTGSVAKHLESANTMFSFIWWIVGFYWLSASWQTMANDSPKLYWLCVIFLAFDVFFVVFCVALACMIGIAVCCCLPCIIAVLYAVADQEGASKEDIEQLPKYKFRRDGDIENDSGDIGVCGGVMTECGTDLPIEHVLPPEDAECCICLSAYDDGAELRQLPCTHHFHCNCIDKWLYINATCPLCKHNILKNSSHSSEDMV